MVVLAWGNSECSILLPLPLMPLVRTSSAGRDWAGVLVDNTVFLSMHVLEHVVEGGRGEAAIHAATEFIGLCTNVLQAKPEIVIGLDANTTLHPNVENFTGPGLMTPLRSHTASLTRPVEAWLVALGVRILNTYEELGDEGLWTCGTKRPQHKRSQIDYLGITGGLSGQTPPSLSTTRSSALQTTGQFMA